MLSPPTLMEKALAETRARVSLHPRVAVVLGSGLGSFVDAIEKAETIPFGSIPGMPSSRVEGHAGQLVFGWIGRIPIVAMQGRVHLYEGHSADEVVFGARLMLHLGASTFVVTNAAGGIDPSFKAGDLMLITDHLNLTGHNCLVGPRDPNGTPFIDMTEAYSQTLQEKARRAAESIELTLREGVYAGLLGPNYETPAEIRMLRTLGASAVGMSTVLEVLAARELGARVLGVSCITNPAAGVTGAALSHEEVTTVAAQAQTSFAALLTTILKSLTLPSDPS